MARPVRGSELVEMAREMIAQAQTAEQLRQAQAVALPLLFGLRACENFRHRACHVGMRRR